MQRVIDSPDTTNRFESTQAFAPRMRHLVFLAICALAVAISGCASQQDEPPRSALAQAETAVNDAVDAGARQHAGAELTQARQHLAAAREANNEENYLAAKRYAQKAQADAELAEAKAERAEANNALAQLEETIKTLEQEIGAQ